MKIRTLIAAAVAAVLAGPAFGQAYNLFQPANGILKGQTSTYVTTAATSTDVISLFGTCTPTQYLRANGTCGPGGSGVSSVGLTMPSGFTVTGSPITTAGTFAVTTSLNGLLKGNGSGFTTALSSDVISLFTGCSGTQYLGADGACHTASGGGGSVAPPLNAVQYNSASAFAGSSSFTYNGNTLNLIGASGIPPLKLNAGSTTDTPLDIIGTTSGGSIIKLDPNNSDTLSTGYLGITGCSSCYVIGADSKALFLRGQGGFYVAAGNGSPYMGMDTQGHWNVAVSSGTGPTMNVVGTNSGSSPGIAITGGVAGLSLASTGSIVGTSDFAIYQDSVGGANISNRFSSQPINFLTGGSTKASILSGMTVGSPTGGDKGVGSLNAQTLYIQGVAVSTSTSPGGAANSIQYNNAGSFGGSANFTFTGANTLTLGDATNGALIGAPAVPATTGSGQQLTVQAGPGGTSTGGGGALNLKGGATTGGGGGGINLTGGAAGSGFSGGAIAITAGAAAGIGTASAVTITGGAAGTTANGGPVALVGGAAGSSSGTTAGGITLTGATPVGTNQSGGAVTIQAGGHTGSGTGGAIQFNTDGANNRMGITGPGALTLGGSSSTFANQTIVANASGQPTWTSYGAILTHKPNDTSRNTTSNVDDTDLVWLSLPAGQYALDCALEWTNSGSGGITVQVHSSATLGVSGFLGSFVDATTSQFKVLYPNSIWTPTTASGTFPVITIRGAIQLNSSGGEISIAWAPATANATVLNNSSWCMLTRMS
jgi:hypothetical protein